MAGFSKIYVMGGEGGFMGADGVNPIEAMILVGDADRQWLEARYFNNELKPLGKLKSIVPVGPDHPDSLLDACIAFCPQYFDACPSLNAVRSALVNANRLDFDASPNEIPEAWTKLREEARPIFKVLNIWQADLVPLKRM